MGDSSSIIDVECSSKAVLFNAFSLKHFLFTWADNVTCQAGVFFFFLFCTNKQMFHSFLLLLNGVAELTERKSNVFYVNMF